MNTTPGSAFDLDAYLGRIGYSGPRTATLDTLRGIHERHAVTIPFENLDVLLEREIRLDLPALIQKLIHTHRGGYCFEQNTLLQAALVAIGFRVTSHLARVRWQVPPDVPTPQTHMLLRVALDGRSWLADAGFGGLGLTAPLDLDTLDEQSMTQERRRLVPVGPSLLQQVKLHGTWHDVYVFDLREAHAIDFEVANWYTSRHPGSRFRENLIVARADEGRRLALFNREFTIRPVHGPAEKRLLESPGELLDVLAEHFGLHFPPDMRFPCPALDWPAHAGTMGRGA